jgi:hypothetical protein
MVRAPEALELTPEAPEEGVVMQWEPESEGEPEGEPEWERPQLAWDLTVLQQVLGR